MNDITAQDIIRFGQQQRSNPALPPVIGNIDEDPDKAQRALDLAKATGVPSTAIYGDLEEFERQHKATLASDIVANNPHLADFVQSDPMVPKIVNDDYGTLDSVSQKVSSMALSAARFLGAPTPESASRYFEGFGQGGPGSWIPKEAWQNYPLASSTFSILGAPLEGVFRLLGGTIHGATETIKDKATTIGGEQFGRDIAGLAEAEFMGLTGRTHVAGPAMEAFQRAKMYSDNAREPPPGVIPEYDKLRAKQNVDDLSALKEATSDAQQSLLRDRNPDLFKRFIEQHTDGEIGISGDAVAKLYGDKLPAVDDNLLGWVPGIADKFALAKETGDDIHIPLADWLAHAEPEIMQALHDDIRVRPGNITINETKFNEAAEPTTSIPEEVPTTRAAAALEPMFSIGDRKLQLQRMLNEDPRFGVPGGFHDFMITDEKGNNVGSLNLSLQNEGKRIYIEDIAGINGVGPRDFGPALMRDLLRQIRAEFPDATELTGHRVSGMREKAGTYMASSALPVIKLKEPRSLGAAATPPDLLRILLEGTQDERAAARMFERASALGMTVEQFQRYDELIAKRHEEDIAAATKRAQEQVAREHTREWKENRKELRKEVASDIRGRPDVAADLFFGSGELYGKKVPLASVKMDAAALTAEQKAGLPRAYYGEKGMHPDEVANLFGYGSGDAMVERLVAYNKAKLAAGGMSARDFVSRMTDIETDRQMEIKHGVLENNILDAVKEQVASETQLNILAEETHALGMKIGQAPLEKVQIVDAVRSEFAKATLASVSSDRYLAAAGRAGRAAEMALLNNDPTMAFQQKQRQFYATVLAREAVQLEKELGKFETVAKRFSRPFDPKAGATIDADYSLFIRSILSQVERPYGMSVQGLEKALGESGYTGLQDFVEKVEKEYSLAGIELPVADYLFDPKFRKSVDDLTVDQFRGLDQSVTALNKFGRAVNSVTVAGEKADRKAWIAQAAHQLEEKFEPQDFGATGKPGVARHYLAALTNLETLFARFDGRDENGIFTKMFTYPAARASNNKDVMLKEYARDYDAAGTIKDPKKKVDSPLVDPLTEQPLTDFTRENVASIVSNMGNEYNWRVLTRGWKVEPDVLWKWIEAHTTVEDFDRAQAVGKLFDKGKAMSDNVYKELYGIAPESIQVRPFTIHGKDYDGWYHPIIYDPIRSRLSKLQSDDPSGPGHSNFWPSTSNAYTKRRTGAIDVISLSQDMVPIKLNQMLHDIAYRDFVYNTAKLTRDDAFRRAVTERYGPEYVSTIDTWLERIAGNASYNSDAVALATRLSSEMRSNVVSTYIAFSATTIEKHGFTAAVMSAKEVGATKFARVTAEVAADGFKHAVMDLFGRSPSLGDSLWKFVKQQSEEIQRRDRNFQETLGGAHNLALGRSTLRSKIIELGSKGVAFSDMLSAVPLWLTKYREVMAETGDAGHATDLADRAVRRAHGSTAITNQPTIVSHTGPLAPWLTTIYGFFGTNMQRRIEIAHDINDAYKLGKSGEIKQAAKELPGIMSSIFTYVVWPGLVEEAVTSQFYDDKSKGGAIGHALAFTLGTAASTFIGIRDLAYGLLHGREPQVGLLSSPLHDVEQLLRDVKKDRPLDKHNAGKLVQDAITVFGDTTGMGPKHVGTALRYGIDVLTHEQRPKTTGDIYRGVISGKQEKTPIH